MVTVPSALPAIVITYSPARLPSTVTPKVRTSNSAASDEAGSARARIAVNKPRRTPGVGIITLLLRSSENGVPRSAHRGGDAGIHDVRQPAKSRLSALFVSELVW